jgi:hypothetical protein
MADIINNNKTIRKLVITKKQNKPRNNDMNIKNSNLDQLADSHYNKTNLENDIIDIIDIENKINNIKFINDEVNVDVEDKNKDLDISQNKSANQLYNSSIYKKWIKAIPIHKTILFEDYNNKAYFKPIADIILDNEVFTTGKKINQKKRNTLIKFIPKISLKDFNADSEWLYIFVINNRIVKIGGTRTGLKGRVSSYLCGHHIPERGKSGDCSKTNGFIYNTFEYYLLLGCKIEMFGYQLPKTEITINIFQKSFNITAQTFHAYETAFLEDYKQMYNNYPILSDNCDPKYKIQNKQNNKQKNTK